MNRKRHNPRAIRFALCSVVATALVSGCAGSAHLAQAGKYASQASVSKSQEKLDRDVAKNEQAVARDPHNAAARALLAESYLHAGRFQSAVTTYNDAIALGDKSAQTALGLALADTGVGRNGEAVAILDQWRDSIPASDLGLALALAGEPSKGVGILAEALRNGDNTPKLRQNLAYAYALAGRWSDARVMAAQDVPADQLDARITKWAMQGKPEDYQQRIAGLLNAPVRTDAGQPQYLALNDVPAAARPETAAAAPSAAKPVAGGELPPIEPAESVAAAQPVTPVPAESVAAAQPAAPVAQQSAAPESVAPASFASAFPTADYSSAASRSSGSKYVSRPVVQAVPARWTEPDHLASKAPSSTGSDCTHLVQLGSFSTETRAQRAWSIFVARNPVLRHHQMKITPALVNGKHYWRVAATGFDAHSAAGMCSAVRSRGGGCLAYAAVHPLPGALPVRGGAVMMARR